MSEQESVDPDGWRLTNLGAIDYDFMSNTSFKSSTFQTFPDEAEPLFSAETINKESVQAYECNICGYISTDCKEVTECCDADAVYIGIVKTEVFSSSNEQ